MPRVVPTVVVRGLRVWIEARAHPTFCSTYRDNADTMFAALDAVPEVTEGWTDYHAAVAVIKQYECVKMASFCGWGDRLHGKLMANKTPLPTS